MGSDKDLIKRRMDISAKVITATKLASVGKTDPSEIDEPKIFFEPVLSCAIEKHLGQVEEALEGAGFARLPGEKEKLTGAERRQRSIDRQTWKRLGVMAKRFGLSRMDLIRAVLRLMATQS